MFYFCCSSRLADTILMMASALGEALLFQCPTSWGDEKGYMTSALIREGSARLPLSYSENCGDCLLKVALIGEERNNIGYRLAPKKEVANKEVVVAEEGRLTLIAQVEVVERRTGRLLFGPLEVRKSLTFDFEPDFSNVREHAFSLGQLEMEPLAEDMARSSLQKLLAQKIVDSLLYCW